MDLLVVGDSHIGMLKKIYENNKYIFNKLKIKKYNVPMVFAVGASMTGITKMKSRTN